ncbi:hypothetical protein B7P43_G15723 [Cryptotermes secundus]|uniref:Endonuclease/exonuclease/phosphatase domain-containing protein n=1 Tax=Cryptotermes secundus TaxID=105785 RepID=A0A2J7PVB6_9NEOP|nr:hypothetical protein B7P43_G15723 [Cryptotermes secundus]
MLLEQLDSYKLDITAIQELRWLGKGVMEKRDHVVFYSCQKKSHMFGPGFGKVFNYSLICAHAPTEDKSGEEKDSFYDELNEIYGKGPKMDCKIIIGDMKAKVGNEDVYRSVIGKHTLHNKSNDNGMRLINFASSRNMVIGGTVFNDKDIHKRTWKSPDGNVFNQIDHILIDVRHCSDLMDVRSYRGANTDSDHYLLISEIRSRISNARKIHGSQAKKLNCGKLVEQGVATRYTGLIGECLAGLSDSEDVSEAWRGLRDVIINAAGAVLGRLERIKYKNWFAGECEQVTHQKNQAYKRMQQRNHTRGGVEEYREARRKGTGLHKKKKREYDKQELI